MSSTPATLPVPSFRLTSPDELEKRFNFAIERALNSADTVKQDRAVSYVGSKLIYLWKTKAQFPNLGMPQAQTTPTPKLRSVAAGKTSTKSSISVPRKLRKPRKPPKP